MKMLRPLAESDETQTYKAIAMSNFGNGPFIKSITMARSPLTAVMKSLYFTELAEKGRLPRDFANKCGNSPEKFFIATEELKTEYGSKVGKGDALVCGWCLYLSL
jgi:hypothetical protein